jgi:hypothetical protein
MIAVRRVVSTLIASRDIFLGAMYISFGLALSYGLALALIFSSWAALWALTGWRLDKIAIWAVLLFLPFAPRLTFLSRVLWIDLDQKIDPEPFYEVLQSMNAGAFSPALAGRTLRIPMGRSRHKQSVESRCAQLKAKGAFSTYMD